MDQIFPAVSVVTQLVTQYETGPSVCRVTGLTCGRY